MRFYAGYILLITLVIVLIIYSIDRWVKFRKWLKKDRDLGEAFKRASKKKGE